MERLESSVFGVALPRSRTWPLVSGTTSKHPSGAEERESSAALEQLQLLLRSHSKSVHFGRVVCGLLLADWADIVIVNQCDSVSVYRNK